MRQSRDERLEAIRSLLPWLGAHLGQMEMSMAMRRYQWVTQTPEPPRRPQPWKTYDCDGVCPQCRWERECQGEPWEITYRWLRRAYRIGDVEDALAHLVRVIPAWGNAVIDAWVDPWNEWQGPGDAEPVCEVYRAQREQRAQLGLSWLERHHKLRGEIIGWQTIVAPREFLPPKERRKQRDRRILEMWGKERLSIREIAARAECSDKTVQKVIKGRALRDGTLV